MLTIEDLRKGYQYFFQEKKKEYKYEFVYTSRSQKVASTFLENLVKISKLPLGGLGKNFLWRYLLFQFNYWDSLVLVQHTREVDFSYIFGKKASERYFQRNQEFDFQIETYEIINKYHLSFLKFTNLFDDIDREVSVNVRSPSRLIQHNTKEGLNFCLEHTTLYDHTDLSCVSCIFKKECKELLRVNYPKIYKNRGYVKTTHS